MFGFCLNIFATPKFMKIFSLFGFRKLIELSFIFVDFHLPVPFGQCLKKSSFFLFFFLTQRTDCTSPMILPMTCRICSQISYLFVFTSHFYCVLVFYLSVLCLSKMNCFIIIDNHKYKFSYLFLGVQEYLTNFGACQKQQIPFQENSIFLFSRKQTSFSRKQCISPFLQHILMFLNNNLSFLTIIFLHSLDQVIVKYSICYYYKCHTYLNCIILGSLGDLVS